MPVTLALPIVPVPFATVQACDGDVGWVFTVTEYALPKATGLPNANVLAPAGTARSVCPAIARTSPVPARPLTVPPTRNWLAEQFTTTFVTFAPPIMPAPPPTVHTWPDGWVPTVTA